MAVPLPRPRSNDDPNGLSNTQARLLFSTKLSVGPTFPATMQLHVEDLTLTRGLTVLRQFAPLGATVSTTPLLFLIYSTTDISLLFSELSLGTMTSMAWH